MISKDIKIENELKNTETPALQHIYYVVSESKVGSDDNARSCVSEICRDTFIRAADQVMHADVDKIAYLNMELGYVEDYYAILDHLKIKYNNSARESLKEYVGRNIAKLEKIEAKKL